MKRIRFTLFVAAVTTVLYLAVEARQGLFSQPFSLKNFLIIGAFAAGASWIHWKRMARLASREIAATGLPGDRETNASPVRAYLGEVLCGDVRRPGRIVYMDWLRVLAAVLVVALHIIRSTVEKLPVHTPSWEFFSDLSSLFAVCNVLFVLISGALILGKRPGEKDDSILRFYGKKAVNVLVPCFLYFLFYMFYAFGLSALYPANWGNLLRQFAGNTTGLTPHFWLVHVILLFYVAAPFFKCLTRQMRDGTAAVMAAVIFLAHCYFLYGSYAGMGYVATTFLGAWDAVFLLGYFCTTEIALRLYRFLLAGAAAAVVFILFAVHAIDGYEILVFNNAPPMLLLGCALFLTFRTYGDTVFSRIPSLFAVLAKYSFPVLMIHWFVFFEIVEKRLGVNGMMFVGGGLTGLAARMLLSTVLTLAISAAFAVVFDNTVVLCVETVLEGVSGKALGKMFGTTPGAEKGGEG